MKDAGTQTIGKALADLCESTAIWRQSLNKSFPHDPRNQVAAEQLLELATYVRELPDSRFGELRSCFDGEGFPGGDFTRKLLSRFGGHSKGMGRADKFLDELLSVALEEEKEFWSEMSAREVVH